VCSLTDVEPFKQLIVFCTTTDDDSTSFPSIVLPPTPTSAIDTASSYTATFSDVIQLLRSHPTTVVACLIDPYATPPRIVCPANDRAASAVAKLVGGLQLQERTQVMLGSAQSSPNAGQFIQRLQSAARHVLMYEDKDLQRYALSMVPLSELFVKASNDKSNAALSFGDHLLRHFGWWYRTKFFTWMNGLACGTCGASGTKCIGATRPNAEEQKWMAGTVEVYHCSSCGAHTRFPRYNHPRKLLESRIGRCGEFANCFTLFCRALGYDSRHITDWTDHVWTEIYSHNLSRWVPFDSCENAWDSPMMYSSGWGKKLTYIFGCSRDDFVDVSSRYVAKYQDMLGRRTLVNEIWLKKCVDALDLTARLRCANKEGTTLHDWAMNATRRQSEAASLEDRRNGGDGKLKKTSSDDQKSTGEKSTENVTDNEYDGGERKQNQLTEAERRGRTTGSVEWRAARGELGSTPQARALAMGQNKNVNCETNTGTSSTSSTSPDLKRAKMQETETLSPHQRMQARVKEVFERLVREGKPANEAAAIALTTVRKEITSHTGST